MLGIANERNRKLDTRIQELERTIKSFTEYHKKVEKKAYERAKKEYQEELNRIQTEIRDATKDGDVKKVETLIKERDTLEPPPTDAPAGEGPPPAFQEWHKENDWYTAPVAPSSKGNTKLSKYADRLAEYYAADPDFPYGPNDIEFYESVKKDVMLKFPEYFEGSENGEEPPARQSRVEGSTPPRKRKAGKKTASDLPPEDRAQMKRFVAEGLLTEAEFLKEYEWDD
jgi:hypothetical protein